jgi:hypothetical protein
VITVRPTADGDLAGLSALFEARFGHPITAEEWTWKYRHLPGASRSLVAVDGAGTVLAHAGLVRLPARWGGGEGGLWQLVDFAGRAGGGGGGLRPPLLEVGRQLLSDLPVPPDVPWMFGFPNVRHFRLGARMFGYRHHSSLMQMAGPLPAAPPAAGCRLETGDTCGDWAAAVWERCAVRGIRRSAAFLNWRYWARPQRYYRFYRLWNEEEAEGLAVFAFVGQEAWAAELWLPPPGEWYAPMLAAAADLRAAGLHTWRFWPLPAAAPGCKAAAACTGAPSAGGLLRQLGLRAEGEPLFVAMISRDAPTAGTAMGGFDPAGHADRSKGSAGAPAANTILAAHAPSGAHAAERVAADGVAPEPIAPAAAAGFYYAMGDYDVV